jgi:hypothetical protein
MQYPQIIGRIDTISLPEFGLDELDCKVDTGANTSSLHCSDIRLIELDGKRILEFQVLDAKRSQYIKQKNRVETFSTRKVKSSFGQSEERYSIETTLLLFGREWAIEFTLSDRVDMKFPVLLGRRFLRKKFIVDVTKKNISKNILKSSCQQNH